MLGSVANKNVEVTKETLVAPTLPTLNTEPINIFTDADWNIASREQVSLLGATYQSIDQAEEYFNSLYTTVVARLADSERRIQEQDSNLKVLLSASRNVASTSIHLKGGDTTSIESNEKYYRTFGPLEAVPIEGVFRLKDTGSFSSIRSLGGFAGKVVLDFSLGTLIHNGSLASVTDGTRNTFWTGTFYTPAPIRTDQNDIPWLPVEYKHGFACMLTYYMDRPTLATEVFIDPITTEPLDLVSISWTPINLTTCLVNGTFETSGNWTYTGASSFVASSLGQGIASGSCVTVGTTGWVSQTFSVSGSYLASGASALVSAGRRCQVFYNMRGVGDLLAGARVVWLNSSNKVIEYRLQEDYPTGFFTSHSFVDYIPVGATSGRVDLGIFTPTTEASAYFDNVQILLGEREFPCQEVIDRPKTISLPEIARSGRFSFVLVQRNPRREVLAKEVVDTNIPDISSQPYLDSTLQNATRNISRSLKNPGPGTSIFSYRLGMKELDLRYREHIPRGSIVSLPLYTRREIRNVWVTAEIGQFFDDNTSFYIYPFANNPQLKSQIQPFGIGDVGAASTTLTREGEILRIHTFEEEAAGWVNSLDKHYLTDPQLIKERFNGTDREGKVRLEFAPHLRRVYLRTIQNWMKDYGIWSTPFDPNLETIYGLPSSMRSTIDAIRTGATSGFSLNSLISREGYIPIKVTVSTDKWTATPDVYGRPDISKVRTALLEELTETTVVETLVEVSEDFLTFEAWLASTTLKEFIHLRWGHGRTRRVQLNNIIGNYYNSLDDDAIETITLKKVYDDLIKKKPHQASIYHNFLQVSYDRLKAQGKIPKNSASTRTSTSAIEIDDVYTTRYKPIITGPGGTFMQLYWFDSTNVLYAPMPRSSYEIMDTTVGLVKILAAPPTSGFTSILADYKYISYTEVEDHFGSVISFATAATGVSGAIAASVGISSKPFPITRNMTDYEDGRIPDLRTPNFDRLSKSYYPVIEYYVNNDGELIFSRDFFKHGDIPAQIAVEYQTLAIQPRVGVEITRSGSPTATPTINNVSLRVRESSPLPQREST